MQKMGHYNDQNYVPNYCTSWGVSSRRQPDKTVCIREITIARVYKRKSSCPSLHPAVFTYPTYLVL